ncbi:Minor fimbrium tip subunit Mfa3 [Porphyromonas levii]|nr:Minor fimbrium tip subunit Mfa3 [Porphyromonas levii]
MPLNKYNRVLLFLSLLLSLFVMGCHRTDDTPDSEKEKSMVYMSFDIGGVDMPVASTRAQDSDLSINTDATDFEDFVQRLAVLVYDANSGDLVKSAFVYDSHFVMEVPVTSDMKFHFCFLANYPVSWNNTLKGIKKYDDLKSTLQTGKSFISNDRGDELYFGATEDNYFPMSRIYENQVVPKGGTIDSPLPFKPTTTAAGSLAPISSYPTKIETSTEHETVNLVRTAAKISLKVTGALSDISRIEMHNIKPVQTYMEDKSATYPLEELILKNFPNCSDGEIGAGECATFMYIPENLLGVSGTSMYWNTINDKPKGGINYITVVMKDGSTQYHIPIICNDIGSEEYLAVATGGGANENTRVPDYSIIRNHEYKFEIDVPPLKADLDLRVKYEVVHWEDYRIPMTFN